MASRDPRADIVENNPFPKPKISRIHSNQDSSNSTIYTMDDLKSMFTNKTQKKPQLKQVWEFSTIEKENLTLATAVFQSCTLRLSGHLQPYRHQRRMKHLVPPRIGTPGAQTRG